MSEERSVADDDSPVEDGPSPSQESAGLWALALALLLLPPALYFGVPAFLNSRVFLVEEVEVEGSRHYAPQDILGLIELDRPRNRLTLDLEAKEAQLRALPWIREAEVRLEGRGRLRVVLHEKEWRWVGAAGRLWLLDEEGAIIRAWQGEDGLDRPLLLGAAAHREGGDLASDPLLGISLGETIPQFEAERVRMAATLRDAVEAALPGAGREVVQLEAEPARHWRVRLRDGAWIRVAERDLEARMERLSQIMRWTDASGRRIDYVLLDGETLDRITVRFHSDAPVELEGNR